MDTWTVARVKDELPLVTVVDERGVEHVGTVRGRMLQHAMVYWHGWQRGEEWAWQTIANALNNGRPLRA
jgi:hypothetical protein